MNSKLYKLIASFTIILAATFFATCPVKAASLTIAPIRQEILLAPGQAQTRQLMVKNTSLKPHQIHLSAEYFSITNEQYDYIFESNDDVKKYIQFPITDFTLQAGEKQLISYNISLPNDAEPGGKYITLFTQILPDNFSDNSKPSVSGLLSSERAGSLLYITIDGDVKRTGKLLDFSTPYIAWDKSIGWKSRLYNTGNIHYYSKTSIELRNIWGGLSSQTSQSKMLLPNAIRQLEGNIVSPNWPGPYRIINSTSFGDQAALKNTRWIIIKPLQFGIILLIATYLSYLIYQFTKKFIKKYQHSRR